MKPFFINSTDIKRKIDVSPNSDDDYLDDKRRRIFSTSDKIELKDKIFENFIQIRLRQEASIKIENCEFKKGLRITNNELKSYNYRFFIYKSNVFEILELMSFGARNNVEIDTCEVEKLCFIDSWSKKIYLYKSHIKIIYFQEVKCKLLKIEETNIDKYSFFSSFKIKKVEFDTDNLAISDYSRFITVSEQTKEQVSEIYHSIVLKATKSIKANAEVNYQLRKATSNIIPFFFGYFYKPMYVLFWMTVVVFIYAVLYNCLFCWDFYQSLYFSAYTFLTIGYGEIGSGNDVIFLCKKISEDSKIVTNCNFLLKTFFVFTEGLLGITYSAALLTSIINSKIMRRDT